MNTTILLTACIDPKGMAFTALQNKEVRLQQYLNALNYYLHNTNLNIVFVENTGYDISDKYKQFINNKRLEVITFQGNDYDKQLGKGYGEALIIKYALKHSILLQQTSNIIKITGRLIISNINALVKQCKTKNCVYCNLVKATSRKNTSYSIFFFAPREFFKNYLIKNIEKINDFKKYYFEHYLNDCCIQWKKDGFSWKEFFLPIIILGQSGTHGVYYKFSYIMYIKQFIRYIAHRIGVYRI